MESGVEVPCVVNSHGQPRTRYRRDTTMHGWRPLRSVVAGIEHRQEGLLRDVDLADRFHPLLAFALFRPQLSLARDVTAIALGRHVLAHGRHGFASDDARADGGLNGHLEHVPVDFGLQLLHHRTPAPLGV